MVILSSSREQYTEDYWLFCSQYCEGEWLVLFLIKLLWNKTMKGTLSANIYWTMMIIVHLICICLIFPLSFFLKIFESVISCHFCHNVLKQSKNYIKFHFQISVYISIGKFTITVTSKHQTPHSRAITGVRQFWCARSQYSFKPSASGKLSQSTTVPSHCEQFS